MKITKNIDKTMRVWSKEYKKGYTTYMILMLIIDKKKYGYEIKQELESLTDNKVKFQDSSLYSLLKKLLKKKYVTYEWIKSDKGPKRKIYTITESGRELVTLFTQQQILPLQKALNSVIKKIPKNNGKED